MRDALIATSAVETQPRRPIFPHSVIRGGVYSAELKTALASDKVAALHYAVFRSAEARPMALDKERLAYVSYRAGNSIYWTRLPVRLAKGETLLTDGEHLARARCGNRISDGPQEPTNAIEPEESELDTPELPDAGFAEAPPIPFISPPDLFVAPDLLSLAAATLAPLHEPLPVSSTFLLVPARQEVLPRSRGRPPWRRPDPSQIPRSSFPTSPISRR